MINDTFLVTTRYPDTPDYVLQRINQAIFTDVPLLQENIRYITSRIRYHLQQRNANDIDRKTLTLVPATDERLYYYDGNSYWRLTIISPDRRLRTSDTGPGYQTEELSENFNTFCQTFRIHRSERPFPTFTTWNSASDSSGKQSLETKRPVWLKCNRSWMNCSDVLRKCAGLNGFIAEGKLPKRITHCDTKVNNMLFDQDDRFLCVIDLDTTMPGFVLSDFGDFIRTAANKGAEDDKELDRVGLDMEIFREFARGYLETASAFLTPIEKQLLPYGAQLLTYMQTVRFLTDYLNGDTYYKIQYPEHNLQRTLAQLTHLHSIDSHLEEMNAWINQLSNQ